MTDMWLRNARIVAAYKAGASSLDLGRQFGLSSARIRRIIIGIEPEAMRTAKETRRLTMPPRRWLISACRICGTEFSHAPVVEQRYCSRACRNVARTKDTGRRCYEAREREMIWSDIAVLVGCKNGAVACMNARRHALRHGLPWPLHIRPYQRRNA